MNGWWRRDGEKFRRCKTLDVSMDGALVVLDTELEDETAFEIHLDMDAEWSVALNAVVLWQRPIFFGRQQLTAVNYRFQQASDHSMFGLWMQRKLKSDAKKGLQEHLAPVVLSSPKPKTEEPVLETAPKIQFVESPWKKVLGNLTAKIPWFDSEPLPQERRRESRGQVGLSLSLETETEIAPSELLNISLSGICIFVPYPETRNALFSSEPKLELSENQRVELVVSNKSLLLGGRRCKADIVWYQRAEGPEGTMGYVVGMRFAESSPTVKKSFVGDLLKRINYNVRQVRSELRFPRRLPARVEVSGLEPFEGYTLDISAGGVSIILTQHLETPCNAVVKLKLAARKKDSNIVSLSSRLLRVTVDNEGRNCYAVAFRKGQSQERLQLSRWLADQLRMQDLDELIPEYVGTEEGASE